MLKRVPLYVHRDSEKAMEWMADEENRESMRKFLEIHGIDMSHVREIRFTNQNFMAFVYEVDEEGNTVISEDGRFAKGEWKKLKYKTEVPTWA